MMIMLYIFGGVALLLILYLAALRLFTHTKRVLHDLALLDHDLALRALDRDQLRIHLTKTIYPDQWGSYPLLWDGQQCLDPGRGLLFNFAGGLQAASPEVARPEQLARILKAAGGWPTGAAAENLLPGPADVNWPSRVPLAGLLDGPPSFRDLALGVTIKDDGQPEIVRADMGKLVHIAVGGSSGWGKSVFLRSLAYQLAKSSDPVDLVLIDLEAATFAPFQTCNRLLWPVADTEGDALAIFQELTGEMDRRRELFSFYPGTDSLGAYNAQAGEPLTPLVALVDEATALLGDKAVEGALRTLALRARKYGLWLVLGGQDWKASSLDTAIRNQLSSRIQFKAMSASQSRVLLQQGGAEDLDALGRALAILPGRAMFVMQAPFISSDRIMEDLGDGGPRGPMPEGGAGDDDLKRRVKALHAEGLGLGAIAEEVYGYRNAKKTAEIKDILDLV
jgi:hypothetical protein